jgi:hypothetical protein
MHRFLWDVHLQPLGAGAAAGGGLGAVPTQLPIQAIPYDSPTAATTPWAAPGTYTIELTVEGKTYSQPIVVRQDPRVKTPALEMQKVYALTSALYFGAADAQTAASTLGGTREQLTAMSSRVQGATAQAIAEFEKKAAALEGHDQPVAAAEGRGGRGAPAPDQPPAAEQDAVRRDHRRHVVGDGCRADRVMNGMQAADVARRPAR